jgi:BASS family bile acid:Na+ symporter
MPHVTRTPHWAHRIGEACIGAMAWSARRGSILLAVGIFGGVASPALATACKWFVTPNVLLMMTLVLLRVDIPAAVHHLRRPGRVVGIVLFQLLVCPLIAWLAIAPLSLDPSIAAGIVIFATGCAAASSSAFARMVGLDAELSLLAMLAMLALVPLTAPLVALQLMGIDLAIGAGKFMVSLTIVVGAPLLISLALRRIIGRARLERWADAVDGLLVWMVVFYGFAVMDGMAARAAADPAWIIQALIAAFAVDYGLNLVTTLALIRWGVRPAATAGLMSGNRNMALFLAVLPATTDPGITLFFGVCQFPLFLSPFLLRPLYRPLLSWAARREGARSHM